MKQIPLFNQDWENRMYVDWLFEKAKKTPDYEKKTYIRFLNENKSYTLGISKDGYISVKVKEV